MKILVLSDSHGNARGVENAVKKYGRNADLIVHCGDATRGEAEDLARKSDIPVVCVRGNCDFVTDLNDIEYLDLCGRRIIITHGHLFGVKYGLERLSYSAEEKGASLVFFGHTHIAADETLGGVRMINPGSCGKWQATCAVVELDDNGNVLVNHVRVPK